MQTMHRRFGKLMKRSADESHVSVLLNDYDNADKLLSQIIETSKAWRDAWAAILDYQSRLAQEFQGLYCPIVGATETSIHTHVDTPEETLARSVRLTEEYEELKTELLTEVNMVDERMIKPAMVAKDYLQPLKKVIKKRDDKKLDFERFQGRVESSRKKTKRSDRDNIVLAKAESDLSRATDEYNAADEHLRAHMPGLISATFSLLPHLLAAQIEIQNTLLAVYYTTLHNYCEEQHLPSPPPPMEAVVQTFDQEFLPVQKEIEAFAILTHGKSVQPRTSNEHKNGLLPNGFGPRRTSNQSIGRKPSASPIRSFRAPSPVMEAANPRPMNGSSPGGGLAPKPAYSPSSPDYTSDTSTYHTPSYSPCPPRIDQRQHSATSVASNASSSVSSNIASMAAAAAAKKKAPPPPPPLRNGPSTNVHFVTALYDFDGESAGDLSLREGDRIRVTKKTDSTDDWWEGELRGIKGSFPANYCS